MLVRITSSHTWFTYSYFEGKARFCFHHLRHDKLIHSGNGGGDVFTFEEFVMRIKVRLKVKASNNWERWNEVFPQGQLEFLNGINVLAEFTGRGELIRIDYTITRRYSFIIDVKLADRNCDLRLFKLRLFFW